MTLFPHRSCYILLAAVIVFDLFGAVETNAILQPGDLAVHVLGVVPFGALVFAAWRLRVASPHLKLACERMVQFFQGMAFLTVSWMAVRLMNHLSMKMTADIGYADPWLSLTGDMWIAYFRLVQSSPLAIAVLKSSYTSLTSLSLVVFVAIMCSRDVRRPGYFMESFFFSAIACTALGAFFPRRARSSPI